MRAINNEIRHGFGNDFVMDVCQELGLEFEAIVLQVDVFWDLYFDLMSGWGGYEWH